jgi:uncharacterized membrane protein
MQCPVCHNEVASESAAFCDRCGAPLSAPAAGTPPPELSYTAPPPASAGTGIAPNMAAALAYLTFIPAVLFLILAPYNKIPLVRFHSWQSIGLAVASLILNVIVRMVLPFGFLMYFFLQSLVSIGLFVVWVIVVLKAFKGEWFKLPIIGDLAQKQAQS